MHQKPLWSQSVRNEKSLWEVKRFFTTILFLFISASPLSALSDRGEISLTDYWIRPIPTSSNLFNKGLTKGKESNFISTPENCGICHKQQYEDWKFTRHSKSTGAGLTGQLMPLANPAEALSCYFCHAPSIEQNENVSAKNVSGSYSNNPSFNPKLRKTGVSCFVCHMREGKIYGPKISENLQTETPIDKNLLFGHKFIEKNFFEDARFCAACHQLEKGYKLNGKILVNTYNEWKESIYGKANIICQKCHMPGRKHLFKGIHDKETTLKGLSLELKKIEEAEKFKIKLIITNSGVGHYFPTYVTPLVVVKAYIIDEKGKIIDKTLKEAFIGRMVSLDLNRELYDTRIAPGKSFEFPYEADKQLLGQNKIVIEVKVYPDMFYNAFYRSLLKNGRYSDKNAILSALKSTEESPYLLWKQNLP